MQYIGFTLNNSEYSIPVLKVREIIHVPHITKMPQAPPYVEGVANLRGNIIPVVNLKKLVGIDGNGDRGTRVIVVASGRVIFGVLVDAVTGVMTIEDTSIRAPELFWNGNYDQMSGVAKVSGRLIILLNIKNLIPHEDISLFEDYIDVRQVSGEQVEVIQTVQTMAGEIKKNELHHIRDFFEKQGISAHDPRFILFDDMVAFIDALAVHDYERAHSAVQNILQKGQNDLFQEVGKMTRKLHDALNSFKELIDPKFKEIATVSMPHAIDSLQLVIDKTEDATNKTLGIVEKYILIMDDLSTHIRKIKEPEESCAYLRDFKHKLEDDLTEILTTQSFQDLTGQTLKKVITLVGDLEEELMRLITTFGVKVSGIQTGDGGPEKVSQAGVDDLLKEFGF